MEKIFMIFYFTKLTPNQKIKLGYISWDDNFRIRHGECSFFEKYFLLFLSFLRFLFDYPISFDEDSFLVWRGKKDKRTEIKYVTIRFG